MHIQFLFMEIVICWMEESVLNVSVQYTQNVCMRQPKQRRERKRLLRKNANKQIQWIGADE